MGACWGSITIGGCEGAGGGGGMIQRAGAGVVRTRVAEKCVRGSTGSVGVAVRKFTAGVGRTGLTTAW
jgi:hypothetical protein